MSPCRTTHAALAVPFGVAALLVAAAAAEAHGSGGGHSSGGVSTGTHSGTGMVTTMPGSSHISSMPGSSRAVMAPSATTPPASGRGSSGQSGTTTGSSSSGGSSSSAPTPITNTPSTGPSDTLGPMPALAPLPQPTAPLPTQFATGGSTGVNLALSPGQTAESQPSAPGGGGKGLAACMGFWDAGTHMSKGEWRAACLRTEQEFPSVQ